MIDPYSSKVLKPLYVKDEARRNVLLEEAEKIPSTVISSAAAANAVMLGGGYFNPLIGYMDLADVIGVAERMQMSSGLFWPTPVVNMLRGNSLCTEIKSAGKIALRDPNVEGNPVIAVQAVEKIEKVTEKQILRNCKTCIWYHRPGASRSCCIYWCRRHINFRTD